MSPLGATYGGALVGSMCVPVCLKNSGYVTLSKCWLRCYITKSSLSCQNILSLDLGKKMSIHKKSDVSNLCIFPRNRNQSIIYTTNQVSGFDMIETYGLNQISNIWETVYCMYASRHIFGLFLEFFNQCSTSRSP